MDDDADEFVMALVAAQAAHDPLAAFAAGDGDAGELLDFQRLAAEIDLHDRERGIWAAGGDQLKGLLVAGGQAGRRVGHDGRAFGVRGDW